MKVSLHNILIVVACVLFALASVGYFQTTPWPWSNRLVPLGLFCWALSELVTI